ncbi:MAG: family 10 glycosylhydrolase [Paludibacteraceae bacterium]|nr:family 10 glycosylhydrolase [Paludibacteraceae bacterium]
MKKSLLFLLLALLMGTITHAENPKHEFRATWLTTGFGIDWPKTKNVEQQKKTLCNIFDVMQRGNMNAACLQVRSFCDAIYQSSYEPWSDVLTGTRGQDPGYDPLAFAIEEAHKRGIELHVWVNPFRVTSSGTLDTTDLVWKNAGQWIIKYNNSSFKGQIIDPGYPEAREYVHKVMMEIVTNYDIDGILMDDYFYAYGGTYSEDANSKALYKPSNVKDMDKDGSTDDDWRRANVDSVIYNLYKALQEVKPWVRFGMGIPGNWSMKSGAASAYGISLPAGISAMESYDYLYCNAIEWAKQGWVDYLNPQIYWSTQSKRQDYDVLCEWWAKTVCENFSDKLPDGKRVHFYASQAAYAVTDSDAGLSGYGDGVLEIQRQIDANRLNLSSGYTGSVFFHTTAYLQLFRDLKASHFQAKALCPPMRWKAKETLAAPTDVIQTDSLLSWSHPTAERFTIYAYPRTIAKEDAIYNPLYFQRVVYGNTYDMTGLGDISQLAIAICSYDRFGVEHEAAVFEGEGYYDFPQVIFWELNGGTVDVELPKYVTETYILPIATKSGYEFAGWYKTKTLRGTPLTEIVEGFEGTLYAKWKELPSATQDVSISTKMAVYDMMGRYIGDQLPTNQQGVFILIQGDQQTKVVL